MKHEMIFLAAAIVGIAQGVASLVSWIIRLLMRLHSGHGKHRD